MESLLEEHYPQHLLNPEYDEMDIKWNLHGILGICSCGCPDEAAKWLVDYLTALEHTDWNAMYELLGGREHTRLGWIAAYWADSQRWTEHDSSISHPWVTEKGKAAKVAAQYLIESEEAER